MASLIMHVGMQKAGSSAIQRSFRKLDTVEALFPSFPGWQNHAGPLSQAFSSQSENRQKKDRKQGRPTPRIDRKQVREEFKRLVDEAGTRKFILSAENFYNRMSEEDLAEFRDFVLPLFDNVRFIAYVRPPMSLAPAAFYQALRSIRRTSLDFAISRYPELEKFYDIFGEERVDIVRFDRESLIDGDIVADFAARARIAKPPTISRNMTASLPVCALLFAFNRQFPDAPLAQSMKAKRLLIRYCDFPDAPKLIFSRELVERNLDAAAIEWLERRLGGIGLDDPIAPANVTGEADLLAADPGWHPGMRQALRFCKKRGLSLPILNQFVRDRRP